MTTLPTWTCSYQLGGLTFVVHVVAASRADAEAHLAAIGESGEVDGELVHEGEQTAAMPAKWGTA